MLRYMYKISIHLYIWESYISIQLDVVSVQNAFKCSLISDFRVISLCYNKNKKQKHKLLQRGRKRERERESEKDVWCIQKRTDINNSMGS